MTLYVLIDAIVFAHYFALRCLRNRLLCYPASTVLLTAATVTVQSSLRALRARVNNGVTKPQLKQQLREKRAVICVQRWYVRLPHNATVISTEWAWY